MSPHVYFITGFPGFIPSRLVDKLATDAPDASFIMLVQPSAIMTAKAQVRALTAAHPDTSFDLIEGDVTRPRLGLNENIIRSLRTRITMVLHLEGTYDLTVSEHEAHRINVLGTDHVNKVVAELSLLHRYVFFSSAYVSGKRTGLVLERDLDHNQSFKNHYEWSKFRAEQLVQERWSTVPTTIVRPGIVIGDSRTGETAKFDGPYFVRAFLDQFARSPIPYTGKSNGIINVVPVDFIVDATAHLAHSEMAAKKVFHLTDPFPYAVHQIFERLYEEMTSRKPVPTLRGSLVSVAVRSKLVRRMLGVPKELLRYFDCVTMFDTTQAREELSKAGIACPDFFSYLPTIVRYYREHP